MENEAIKIISNHIRMLENNLMDLIHDAKTLKDKIGVYEQKIEIEKNKIAALKDFLERAAR